MIGMSEREAAVLAHLTERAGTIISKEALARALWAPGTDPHLVEVTIARLRQRLGHDRLIIETVRRRGYVIRQP